jgi:hypothetical protein
MPLGDGQDFQDRHATSNASPVMAAVTWNVTSFLFHMPFQAPALHRPVNMDLFD